ncbi:MAG: hypothetical protein AB7E77_11045, partial [Desulfobulbus sp.]
LRYYNKKLYTSLPITFQRGHNGLPQKAKYPRKPLSLDAFLSRTGSVAARMRFKTGGCFP